MIFGFLLAICFDPFTWTAATQPRWALLAIALPLLLSFSSPNNLTLAHLLGALFVAWASLSLTWTANLWDGIGEIIQLIIIAMAFLYGSRSASLEQIFKGLALGVTISSLILISPIKSLSDYSIIAIYPHGLFGNRNMLSEIAALITLGCIAYRKWLYLPGLMPAIFYYKPEIMSGPWSRGALLALGAGLAIYIWQWSRWAAFGLLAICSAISIVSIDYNYRIASLIERIEVWKAIWNGSNWLGHGTGSLFTIAPYLTGQWDTTLQRVDHAHNDALEIYFSYGIIGTAIYAAIIICALRSIDRRLLPVLVAFLIIGTIAFPWHIPANAFVGALVLGHAVRNGKPVRNHYHDWRARLCAWYESKGRRSKPNLLHAMGKQAQPI